MMIRLIAISLVLSFLSTLQAQKSNLQYRQAEELLIIETASQNDWKQVQQKLTESGYIVSTLPIAPRINMYGIYPYNFYTEIKHALESDPQVLSITKNYKVDQRLMPNDELFTEQWALDIIQASEAWNEAKGDTTALGDEIVIAVLDDGFLTIHPDLEQQIWTNPNEIEDNGIDDDNNGYIDDYRGWNVELKNDDHIAGDHGSPVAGIIGASTDNIIGVAGTAYNTKLLPLSSSSPTLRVSHILGALEYIYVQRDLYNETNGEKGAFIVAANLSLGIDGLFPEDVAAWCNLLDSLGKIGVLTINSVTNSATNIDTLGDVPALCPSDYIITITRTDRDDEKSYEGGYSQVSVDLAAPGDDIITTDELGTYDNFSGTSASAPFVSGAVATLYSIPCKDFARQAKTNPAQTALIVKDLIMNNVDEKSSLDAITVSGGRLNIFASLTASSDYCEVKIDPFELQSIYPNPSLGIFNIDYTVESFEDLHIEVFDIKGRRILSRSFTPEVFGARSFQIDLGNTFQDGMYLIRLQQQSDTKWGKILLQKHN